MTREKSLLLAGLPGTVSGNLPALLSPSTGRKVLPRLSPMVYQLQDCRSAVPRLSTTGPGSTRASSQGRRRTFQIFKTITEIANICGTPHNECFRSVRRPDVRSHAFLPVAWLWEAGRPAAAVMKRQTQPGSNAEQEVLVRWCETLFQDLRRPAHPGPPPTRKAWCLSKKEIKRKVFFSQFLCILSLFKQA